MSTSLDCETGTSKPRQHQTTDDDIYLGTNSDVNNENETLNKFSSRNENSIVNQLELQSNSPIEFQAIRNQIEPQVAGEPEQEQSDLTWLQSTFFIDLALLRTVGYLSVWAILGTTLRAFLDRIMGQDCEFPNTNSDFLTPFSKKICVTASGLSSQTGGALFVDLPANMLGSFVLATMTSPSKHGPQWPWFRRDHPLQQHDALILAIKVGFCGSLTTFSAWNTQMVTMLDGTITELGPQIVPALFGYFIGVLLPVACFIFGTHCHAWFLHWNHPPPTETEGRGNETGPDEKSADRRSPPPKERRRWNPALTLHSSSFSSSSESTNDGYCHPINTFIRGRKLPFLLVPGIFIASVIADTVMNIAFYRTLWLSMLLTPPGALLRWQMAKLNSRELGGPLKRFNFVPWGTLIVNICGSVLSALTLALEFRLVNFQTNINHPWILPIMKAIANGFCGSVTTVSTFCRELVDLSRTYPSHAKPYFYALISVLPSMLLSLCVFSPIVRSK
jgi:fluoride ion exporter CrcB/FEX